MLDTSLKAQDDRNPVPSFLNTINERIKMRQALNAEKERQDYYNELRSKINTGGNSGNKPTPAGIGADANGVYGVGSSNPVQNAQPSASISVGSYAGDVTPQSNKFTFNESDYVPSAQNGYHLGDYPQTEMYGDPTDYQRQMAANAIGYNLGSLEPRQQKWFTPTANKESDHGINITDQGIGQNYNQRIDSQVGGMNFPRTPQMPSKPQDSFGKAFSMAENPTSVGQSNWNTLKSFQNPVSDVAPTVGGINTGATGNQAFDEKMNLRRWLEWDAQHNGVTNPLVSLDRYNMFMQPMREQAEADELRNAYYTLNNPNASDQEKMNAISLIEYNKKNPYLGEDQEMKMNKSMYDMGYIPENGFGGYDGDGGEYGGDDVNARAIYSHLASQGLPANVIAGIMGNLQAESNFNSSAVGDGGNSIGLAQWYAGRGNNLRNFAQQRGKEWNDVGTQLDFLLDEIKQSNPDLLKRMANLSPHDAAILFHDEFEKSADTPEMKARRGQYATDIYGGRRQGSGNKRYRRNPYAMTPMQKMKYQHDLRMEEIAARNAYRNGNRVGRDGSLGGFDSTGKTGVGLRQSAMSLAQLQNVSADDAKGQENYNKEINNFAKNIASAYRLGNSSLDSNTLGLAVYNELNKTKSGLRPESLARAAATAVYLSRGDVDAGDLQRLILQQVYSQGQQQTSQEQPQVQQQGGNKKYSSTVQYDANANGGSSTGSSWDILGGISNGLKGIQDSVQRIAKDDGAIGSNKAKDDWNNMWDSIAERNKQESKKRKEEYEEKKRKEEAKRNYLEATR